MDTLLIGIVVVPGAVALLLLLVFSFLYRQSRDPYFRCWQIGWVAYCLNFALLALYFTVLPSNAVLWAANFAFTLLAGQVLRSTRALRHELAYRASDAALAVGGALAATLDLLIRRGDITFGGLQRWNGATEVWIAAVLVVAAVRFNGHAERRNSTGFRLLAFALLFWAGLLATVPFHRAMSQSLGDVGHFLGPMPQMLLGIAMVVVLFENERRSVQENLLTFSSLEVDPARMHTSDEIVPNVRVLLERLVAVLNVRRAGLCINTQWRATVPSVECGFSPEFLARLDGGVAEFLS